MKVFTTEPISDISVDNNNIFTFYTEGLLNVNKHMTVKRMKRH